MKRIALSILFITVMGIQWAGAQSYVPETNETRMKVKPAVEMGAYAFDLGKVELGESIFREAMEAEVGFLRSLEPDRFLSQFRSHAGLKPKAERYGGWESEGLAGHSLGHYLSSSSMYYAVRGDTSFLNKINYVVDELALIQKKRGTGYVGAIPNEDSVFYRVALGNIRSSGFYLNGAWAPWYTIHKIMAGLMDAYLYAGSEKALEVNKGIADWASNVLRGLTYEEVQKMLRCEYGGINEALANMYALTGDKKYLDLSYRFHDNFILDSLAVKVNPLPGKHSNTQVPKVIGAARRYELTGKAEDRTIAEFFWETMVNHHTYAPGGNSNYEHLGQEDKLNSTLTDATMETCNTHNMLKLTRHLFAIEPSAHLMDYYERALYNHILASQNRANGMVCYYVPLRMGTKKEFSTPRNSFTCCVGTGMENHVKYGESIYYKGKDGSLFVNLFIPSTLTWQEQETEVRLDSNIPENELVAITLQPQEETEFTIRIRKPYWAGKEITFKVNDDEISSELDSYGYYELNNNWKPGDKITFKLPMGLHKKSMPDNEDRMAFFYGPVLLAGDLGETEPDPTVGIPVFITEEDYSKWLQPKDKPVFATADVGLPQDVSFRPFYSFYDSYYSVYWDVFDQEEWDEQQKIREKREEEKAQIEARTIDVLKTGDEQSRKAHNIKGENIRTGESHTRDWLLADDGGYLSVEMKVSPTEKNELILTYWGMENRSRNFEIFIEGKMIGRVDLFDYKVSKFYDIHYAIPNSLIQGKEKITVKLQALPHNQAGPIYGIRTIRGN